MKRLLLAAAIAALTAPHAPAAWWAENDYSAGSNGLKKNSLTVFRNHSRTLTSGLNVSFYKDSAGYGDRVYSFRLPVMYSGPRYFIALKPFIYPVSPHTRSGAAGGRLYLMTSLSESQDESYTHLVISGAWARQKAFTNDAGAIERKTFSQSAFELQAERSFYGQFFFQISAAGFPKPAGASNSTLRSPALDQSDLAYLGTYRQVTALPEWALTAQVARSMKPEYDSFLYAGYSKISFRESDRANSVVTGMKLRLTERSSLDLAYNAYKQERSVWKNYYKIFLQIFF
ncbi:MAG: hypothetical protein Q7R35_14855 [Elusimicrobiota bacterium]|nr:hypothetical protein [Elusimicrobiota bacterium]